MFIFCRTLFAVIALLLLTGCATLSNYATGISNKNPDTVVKTEPAQKCDTWCHNGWCSEHCEPAVSGN